jgi:hypothetical protein
MAARSIFPTNRFSDNYNRRVLASRLSTSERHGNGTTNATSADLRAFTSFLYRLKKYQYVFLKHVLQHGLNIGVAMESVLRLTLTDSEIANAPAPLVDCVQFRLYWLCVNAAFVFEFFMQTLVKKRMLKQRTMLGANVFLMLTSSMAVFFRFETNAFPGVDSFSSPKLSQARTGVTERFGGAGGGGDAGKYQCRHRRMASGNNRRAFAVRGAGYGGGEEGARVGSSSA